MNSSPIHGQRGRPPLERDSQQWLLDYLIKETGKPFHFQEDGHGGLPKAVRSHAMISKHVGREAQRLERVAEAELAAGHAETALTFYFSAALTYLNAQHPIFELNEEKRFLFDAGRRCYAKVIDLAPYRIEHLEIPWGDGAVFGNLHLNPNVDGPAPLLFYVPGCDAFKEAYPHPNYNIPHQRGFHVFSFEGPGQAGCNLLGMKLTADNYEHAAKAMLDTLVERPEIDEGRMALYANSFGSVWGLRLAALDPRFKAVAATQSSIAEKFIHMDLESPRWKQLFAFLTHARDEAELDQIMRDMTLDGTMAEIQAPVLLTVGEYDQRAPLDEVYPLFEQLRSPAELWIMEDQHHNLSIGDTSGPYWGRAALQVVVDWLKDRLAGKPLVHEGQVVYVRPGDGPYSPTVQPKRRWYEG